MLNSMQEQNILKAMKNHSQQSDLSQEVRLTDYSYLKIVGHHAPLKYVVNRFKSMYFLKPISRAINDITSEHFSTIGLLHLRIRKSIHFLLTE